VPECVATSEVSVITLWQNLKGYHMYEGPQPQGLSETRRGITILLTFFSYGFSVCHPNANNLRGPRENLLIKGEMEKGGVKGILPLGCLPLWGREGVTLTAFFRSTTKNG
jgi:hypothetical protein